jgi:hypothetical protein
MPEREIGTKTVVLMLRTAATAATAPRGMFTPVQPKVKRFSEPAAPNSVWPSALGKEARFLEPAASPIAPSALVKKEGGAATDAAVVVKLPWARWVQLPENSTRSIFVTPGAVKSEKHAQHRFQGVRNSTTIASYKARWISGTSKGKKQWYDDLGGEISQGLMQFRDPLSFVFPAAVTVYVAPFRKTAEKAFNKAKPTTPHTPAVIKPPVPHVISAPTSLFSEPGATSRIASERQAQIPRHDDTGTFGERSQAPTSAKRAGTRKVIKEAQKTAAAEEDAVKNLNRNRKKRAREKRAKAKKAASLVDIAEEAASPARHVVKIVDSGASGATAVGALPLTVGSGTGYDRDMVARDGAVIADVERKDSVALGIYCEFSDPAVRAAALASHDA